MKKLMGVAAVLAASVLSSSVQAVSEGEYYYRPSNYCESDTDAASDNRLLTIIGNNSNSRVQINLALLESYPVDGIQYLEQAQDDNQIAIVEKASKTLVNFSQDTMYIIAKERLAFKDAQKLPTKLASSEDRGQGFADKVDALGKQWGLSPDDIVTVQTGARVLVQEETNEVFLKSFFTVFDVDRLERHLLTIDHFEPMKEKLQNDFSVSANQGACAVKI